MSLTELKQQVDFFITIVTPTYNAERTIETCLNSVAAQTFRKFEHLIVDGLSSDLTIKIARIHQSKFGNIRILEGKDLNVYDAMNKGVMAAKSEWIYFLGADDTLINEGVLMELNRFVVGEAFDLVYGNVLLNESQRVYDGKFNLSKILTRNICHQAIVYNASVFRKLGSYNTSYKILSDYDFNLRCWLSGKIKCKFFPLTIARYSENGLSSISEDAKFLADFPNICIDEIIRGDLNFFRKTYALTLTFRKIDLRYGAKYLKKLVANRQKSSLQTASYHIFKIANWFFSIKKNIHLN